MWKRKIRAGRRERRPSSAQPRSTLRTNAERHQLFTVERRAERTNTAEHGGRNVRRANGGERDPDRRRAHARTCHIAMYLTLDALVFRVSPVTDNVWYWTKFSLVPLRFHYVLLFYVNIPISLIFQVWYQKSQHDTCTLNLEMTTNAARLHEKWARDRFFRIWLFIKSDYIFPTIKDFLSPPLKKRREGMP